ncbi:MAG: hypothetical protein R2867_16250 [Caldilineaceae bacterium]
MTSSGTNTPALTFWVHRFDGNNNGPSHELQIDIMNSAGNTVIQNNALVIDNNALDQDAWIQQTVDLTAYKATGEVGPAVPLAE